MSSESVTNGSLGSPGHHGDGRRNSISDPDGMFAPEQLPWNFVARVFDGYRFGTRNLDYRGNCQSRNPGYQPVANREACRMSIAFALPTAIDIRQVYSSPNRGMNNTVTAFGPLAEGRGCRFLLQRMHDGLEYAAL